jgi:uncharacterized membrane protein YqjE
MLRRLIEARFAGVRRLATDVVDGLDDRTKLFVLELAAEQQRLTRLAILALGALIVSALAVVWAAATLVAFTWDTEWRHTTLLALLAFWIICALALCLKARNLLKAGEGAFRLSRQVASDDFTHVREVLR